MITPDRPQLDDFEMTIPEAYLLAIGRVTVAWGILESAVDLGIGRLLNLGPFDSRGAIVTAHMTWPLKMDVLEALANTLAGDYPFLAAFGTVKPLLKKAQEGRNLVVHGHWAEQHGKVYRLRATARGKLRTDLAPVELATIEAARTDIWTAGSAMLKVVFNITE